MAPQVYQADTVTGLGKGKMGGGRGETGASFFRTPIVRSLKNVLIFPFLFFSFGGYVTQNIQMQIRQAQPGLVLCSTATWGYATN